MAKIKLRTYAGYSILCTLVWTVLLVLVYIFDTRTRFMTVLGVGCGWAIGWLSATIARAHYPGPTKK